MPGSPGPVGITGGASASGGADREDTPELEPSAVPDTVRTYFPETWLFDLHTVKSVRSSCADKLSDARVHIRSHPMIGT